MKSPSTKANHTGLSPAVLLFAQQMQRRLSTSGRSGYHRCRNSDLMDGLQGNAVELSAALLDGADAMDAAADVANYAMFIALNQLKEVAP